MKILIAAPEKQTYKITISFEDSQGNAVTPNSASWTLTDRAGNVINARSDVDITPLAQTVDIVLSGDDLALSGDDKWRMFTVEYIYDSTEGTDLPMAAQASFPIDDLKIVS